MGGHVNPGEFSVYPNVTYLNSLAELPEHLRGVDVSAPPSNDLFAGQEVIPRLTLSSGCLFSCEFCMVPRGIAVMSEDKVWEQVEAFKPLKFDLVYLDDKSFGQAPNWRMIGDVWKEFHRDNPSFKGFIIQTTANIAAGDGRRSDGNLEAFHDLGVKYMEIGVESVNPETIRAMRKPHRSKHLELVMKKAREVGMPVIPNFIFGHPLDTGRYDNFILWTEGHRDIIPAVNVNFLSVLHGAVNSRHQYSLPKPRALTDLDQNAYRKSWLSSSETIEMVQAVRAVYYTTSGKDFFPSGLAQEITSVHIEDILAGAGRRMRRPGEEARVLESPLLRPHWREQACS